MKRTKPERLVNEAARELFEAPDKAIARLRVEYERGDPHALLEALAILFRRGGPIPMWLADAVAGALEHFNRRDVRTLDEAFNVTRARGSRFDYEQRLHTVGAEAYILVREAEDKGRALTDELFDDVGERLGLGKNTARKYFEFWRDAQRVRTSTSKRVSLKATTVNTPMKRKPTRRT